MATIHYTPAQNAAIHWKGGNLLLSAAAGSGKTATLTGRILWLLEQENVSIREMCVVTYTRAAAAELRERIAGVLRERVRETGSRHLAAQLAAVSGADIATIHAFLYKSLRPFFSALGLSPDFTIGDEAIMQQLRTEAMAEIVDECFEAGTDEFLSLADTLSITRDTQSLDKTLLEIDRALSAAGKTPSALSAYAKTLLESVDTGADFFTLPQSDGFKTRLAATVAHFQTAISDVRMAFTPVVEEKYGPYADAFLDWLRRISRALEVGSYADVREALSSDGLPPRLATVTAKNATEESLRFKALRDEGKKVLASLRASLFVFEPAEIPSVLSRTGRDFSRHLAVRQTVSGRRHQAVDLSVPRRRAGGILPVSGSFCTAYTGGGERHIGHRRGFLPDGGRVPLHEREFPLRPRRDRADQSRLRAALSAWRDPIHPRRRAGHGQNGRSFGGRGDLSDRKTDGTEKRRGGHRGGR